MKSVALPGRREIAAGRLVLECEIDIVILALTSYSKTSCLDAREDDSD